MVRRFTSRPASHGPYTAKPSGTTLSCSSRRRLRKPDRMRRERQIHDHRFSDAAKHLHLPSERGDWPNERGPYSPPVSQTYTLIVQ